MLTAIDTQNLPRCEGAAVTILCSWWYSELVMSMAETCKHVLVRHGAVVTQHILPGCLELPLASELLCRGPQKPDAIVCFGVIVKGDTLHFDMIVPEVARGLNEVSQRNLIPILNEVLPVATIEDAQTRASDDEYNKGNEAAAAALRFISWQRSLAKAGMVNGV